ncbi:DUF6127 family protein [Erythrobacter sp. HA6-11]
MTREDLLARLMAQAADEGSDIATLRAIVEETSEMTTNKVLGRLGLSDADASEDLDELRELLRAWRDAKASVWKAFIDWAVRAALALLLIGIAVRLGAWQVLK